MITQIQRTTNTTIMPRAYEELKKRENNKYYNFERNLRHPLGIYNLSLRNILVALEQVLDEYDKVLAESLFKDSVATDWGSVIIHRQEHLISKLMYHFDDCLSILSCFFPYSVKSNRTFKNKREEDKNKRKEDRSDVMKNQAVRDAMSRTESYRNYIGDIANHIKHHQGALRSVVIYNDNVAILGYFIEHVSNTGAVGPHPDIHGIYNGQFTAFSFNRNLRYILGIIYSVSEILADAIVNIAPLSDIFKPDNNPNTQLVSVIKRIEGLPKYMFPDELHQEFPNITLSEQNNLSQLDIDFASNKIILPALSGKITTLIGLIGDGVTKTFTLPYKS